VQDRAVTRVETTVVPLIAVNLDTSESAVDTVRATEVHSQEAPVDRGFFLIRTSDGLAELRLLGSIRLTAILDFNGLQGRSFF
jgi:hypothetical protein